MSVVKHACAYWFEKNEIPLDGKFRNVMMSKKTARMHSKNVSTVLSSPQSNIDIKDAILEKSMNETMLSIKDAMSDEEVLTKIIEKTIASKFKTKQEKNFYQSLKPTDIEIRASNFYYSNTGAKVPNKNFIAKKPRFISFKMRNGRKSEQERPLHENLLASEILRKQTSKLQEYKTNLSHLGKNTDDSMSPSLPKSKVVVKKLKPQNPTSLELIKQVCLKYGLTRKEVFEIHSQFKAMTIPLDLPKHEGNTVNSEYFDSLRKHQNPDVQIHNKLSKNKDFSASPNNLESGTPMNNQMPEGIRLEYSKN